MLLNFVKKFRVFFKIGSYLRWVIIIYFCYLDLNNIYLILIPVLLLKLGIGLFVKYLYPKITNKTLKTLLLFLLVIVSLIWSLYLCFAIWNFVILSGIMLELLPFLLLFAKNILLVNGNLYCDSTILFWSEAFEHTGDLQTDEQLYPTASHRSVRAPGYETTSLNVSLLKEVMVHQVRANIEKYGSNFNLIDDLVLDLLKNNLLPSSLKFYIDPEISSATLDEFCFDYFFDRKLLGLTLPTIPVDTNVLSDFITKKEIFNSCINNVLEINDAILTDLIEEALVRNRKMPENLLNNGLEIAKGYYESELFQSYKVSLANHLGISDYTADNWIKYFKEQRKIFNRIPLSEYYANSEIDLFSGVSEDLNFIFSKYPSPIKSGNGSVLGVVLSLDLLLFIKDLTLNLIIDHAYESLDLVKDTIYETFQDSITDLMNTVVNDPIQKGINDSRELNLYDLTLLLETFDLCKPSQQLPLIVLLFNQHVFPIRDVAIIAENVSEILKEETGHDNIQNIGQELESQFNSSPKNGNKILTFFSNFEYSHIKNTFRFRDRSLFNAMNFLDTEGKELRVPFSSPINTTTHTTVHTPAPVQQVAPGPIIAYLGQIKWENTDKMITSHNIHLVSNYLKTLPLNEDGTAVFEKKYLF